MPEWEPVIGLEIHVQLQTKTKMFCGCELSFGEAPNTRTCPVCLGLPGALPVANAEAVHYALMIGMALGCEIAPRSIFHRKNYFYPDSPKAYQISQYDIPICGAGRLGDIRIHRAHLEEDAAKLVHAGASGRIHSAESSVVDFNRCGTPLVEIVTEPDVRSAQQASEWLRLLRVTLRQLGVSDVNMEEGSLRCDANVSIRPKGSDELGTKTELKNMNSFRFLERGVDAEIARQIGIAEDGGTITQETLHFDPRSGSLSSLRSKEEAHDYRYFPEPDLVAIAPTEAMLARAREALPELPAERAARLESELGLAQDAARLLAFRPELGDLFEAAAKSAKADPRPVANWVTGELQAQLGDREPADTELTPAGAGCAGGPRGRGGRVGFRRQGGAGRAAGRRRRPCRHRRRARPGQGGRRRAGRDRRPGAGGQPRRGGADQGRQPEGHRRHRRGRDEGHQGHRRRRRGPAAGPGAVGGLR